MSWAWTIPVEIKESHLLRPPLLCLDCTRVIVPTHQDWNEARITIDSILACRPRPAEIVLVNDNADVVRPAWLNRYPIFVVDYPSNRGPSFARNAGARFRSEKPIDWFYFTDTGCFRDTTFFAELVDTSMVMPRTTVAIAAPVVGFIEPGADSPINRYMTEEAILNPPRDAYGPQAIVTANAAISAAAFRASGGFDTSYPFAAGEDLDLGLRLRRLGSIGWAKRAVVIHRFVESEDDFRRRFVRYGAGTAHLERTLALPSLRPQPFVAKDSTFQKLAKLQVDSMLAGYDSHLGASGNRRRHLRLGPVS